MLNEEKVRLMTELALQERKEGQQEEKIGNWFKGDFISRQMLVSFLCATVAFAAIFVLYAFLHLEEFLSSLYSQDLSSLISRFLFVYLLFLAAFLGITYLVYSIRYNKAKKSQLRYYQNLCKLQKMYREKNAEDK